MLASKGRKPVAMLLAFALTASLGATALAQEKPERKLSPLEWLKQRSPTKRWNFLKKDAARQKEARLQKHREREAQQGQVRVDELNQPEQLPVFDSLNSIPLPGPDQPVYENVGQSTLIGPISTIQPVGGLSKIDIAYEKTTSNPDKLKRVTEILPYGDYQPSMTVRRKIDPELVAPEEVELSKDTVQPRQMEPLLYQWHASNLHHYPLYFEDPSLERYGHSFHPLAQPFVSTGRMSLQLLGLPYQMTIDPVCKPVYTLGWYRPGECAPKQVYQIPWNTRAAITQAGVTTGAFFALP
jgi:hypothetical protein